MDAAPSPLLTPLSDKAPVVDDTVVELTVENGPRRRAPRCCARSTRAQIPVAGLALREPSLDDVFLSLTGHKTEATRPTRSGRPARAAAAAGPQSGETDGKDAA